MNILLYLKHRRRNHGPFTTELFNALLSYECMNCGGAVYSTQLFSNALVATKGAVRLLCRPCRGGGKMPKGVFTRQNGMKIRSVIAAIGQHKCSNSGEQLCWDEVLYCIRHAGYLLSRHVCGDIREPHEYFTKSRSRTANSVYGYLEAFRGCQECGAFWGGGSEERTITALHYPHQAINWDDEKCWHCKLPHDLQWHMRTTYKEEQILLCK